MEEMTTQIEQKNKRTKAFQVGFMVGHWHRCGLPDYFDN
jgi:hypothetical protein